MGKKKLVTRIAEELLEKDCFETLDLENVLELWREAEIVVRAKVRQLRSSTLGVIVASGKACGSGKGTSLYGVHSCTYLDKYSGGKELLRLLAMTAIVAEMWDEIKIRKALRTEAAAAY